MRQVHQYSHSALAILPTSSVVQCDAGSRNILACMVADAVAVARLQEQSDMGHVDSPQESGEGIHEDLLVIDGKLNCHLTFDVDIYAKAVPLFKTVVAALAELGHAGNDLEVTMQTVSCMMLDKFGEQTAENMKPYIVRFIEDRALESDAGRVTPFWTEFQVQEISPVVCKSIVEAMERGFVQFPEAALYARDYIAKDMGRAKADAIPFALIQGAYISLQGRYKHLGTTPKVEVVSFESLAELQQKCQGRADGRR